MAHTILDVFNRYRLYGGEEFAAENIRALLATRHQVHTCQFSSEDWTGPNAPNKLSQAGRLFYNKESRHTFETALTRTQADLAVFHNIYPIGSPSLYHAALKRGTPVVQFLHNYRPFSVGGSLYSRGRLLTEPLRGAYWTEVREAAWMGSVTRSAMMAILLKLLHRSGWLKSVKMWIAISDFMRDRLIEAGAVPAERITTLRHSWDALPETPPKQDAGYYLYLGRLIEEKGIPMLLKTWDILYTQLGKATPPLHICGDGPLADLVQRHARSNPYLCVLGRIGGEDKKDELLRCRAVIIPSVWWEPLGLVTYEAYDYAKPVLAARAGGLSETVQHGNTGFLHEPGNVDNLVQDILNLEAMSPSQRAGMGTSGRHWLRQETDPTLWLRRFDEIIARVSPQA
jgi:glycosyltransferase involved in cell wall biosynthesis